MSANYSNKSYQQESNDVEIIILFIASSFEPILRKVKLVVSSLYIYMQTNFIKGSRVVHMIHCVIRIMCMSPFPVYPKLYG